MAEHHGSESCCCSRHPVWKYLENTFLSDKEILPKAFKRTVAQNIRAAFATRTSSIVYTGGTIRPIANGIAANKVESIGFHDGRVVASGTSANVLARMDALGIQYTKVKLSGGQTLLPGMIEPHLHIVPTALMLGWADLGPFAGQSLRSKYNVDWLKDEVNSIDVSDGSESTSYWILGRGVDPSLMPFEQHKVGLNKLQKLGVDEVDAIRSDVPVMMISASMHTAYVNTKAAYEVYKSSAAMQAIYPTFEKFRDHVNTNGGLQEMGEMFPAFGAIPKVQILESVFQLKSNLDLLFQTANKRGVTLIYDAASSSITNIVLDLYFLLENPRVRIGYALLCDSLETAKGLSQYEPPTNEHFYQGTIKLVSDGSNQGLTGYQNKAYRCEPAKNFGAFNFPPFSHPDVPATEFTEIVQTVVDKGWPLMIHANGDKAVDITIAAYESSLKGSSGLEKRHRIEHCSILSDTNIAKMAKIGISPSFLIGHVGYWGYGFRCAIFEEKAELLDRSKSALDKGMRITLHSDDSVSPMGPLRMMEQAVTRIMEGDSKKGVLNANEKITVEEGLRAITYDAAWQCHADQWVGSLETGKRADYVILAEDPITRSDPVGMRDIEVLQTWVGGVKKFSS